MFDGKSFAKLLSTPARPGSEKVRLAQLSQYSRDHPLVGQRLSLTSELISLLIANIPEARKLPACLSILQALLGSGGFLTESMPAMAGVGLCPYSIAYGCKASEGETAANLETVRLHALALVALVYELDVNGTHSPLTKRHHFYIFE